MFRCEHGVRVTRCRQNPPFRRSVLLQGVDPPPGRLPGDPESLDHSTEVGIGHVREPHLYSPPCCLFADFRAVSGNLFVRHSISTVDKLLNELLVVLSDQLPQVLAKDRDHVERDTPG